METVVIMSTRIRKIFVWLILFLTCWCGRDIARSELSVNGIYKSKPHIGNRGASQQKTDGKPNMNH